MPADERAARVLALVQRLAAEVHPSGPSLPVTFDSQFDDLGIGSLELAELLLRVQNAFGVTLPAHVLGSAETPRDLLRAPRGAVRLGHSNRLPCLCLTKIDDAELNELDLSSWRLAFNGAEPVSARTVERFIERFRAFGFRPETMTPVYGLAESSVGLAFPPLGRAPLIDRLDRGIFVRSGRAESSKPGDPEALSSSPADTPAGPPDPHRRPRRPRAR
ncbi:phosphopantetheine-binding protein [Candidatus Mycolicibacterium alkanivorans]|uniref:Phosphopantetheine-binding protein n=1 Tax=Candidatus Mycolicibacterium alkanivorans TaxID=2954114 RepID=A0ABS9YRS7_9MYCO|nr:phosphopantetheine-binding protein [Candidatus Mycolicibacterium alkanivorans]MCI4673950.1 phosphopantetheine-binding protein [Candidatus Mycolicibacterium alkanivorans]